MRNGRINWGKQGKILDHWLRNAETETENERSELTNHGEIVVYDINMHWNLEYSITALSLSLFSFCFLAGRFSAVPFLKNII